MEVLALEPRDAGYAMAALAIAGEGAADLARRAPRGAGPALEEALKALLASGLAEAKQALGSHVGELRRSGPGATLARVHPSWLADALADEAESTIEAVLHCLPEEAAGAVRQGLARLSRAVRGGLRPAGLKAELEPLVAERWRQRAFPHAGAPAARESPELAWLFAAPPEEIELVAREIGIRAVARAFCGISREDLAKLCQGLPPNDSVRLVSAVVELRDALKAEELRPLQRQHLKLLKAGGVSAEIFFDTGLTMIAGALVGPLGERGRHAVAYRLPELLGRRLLDLSAPGAVVAEKYREIYAREIPEWLAELKTKGIAAHYQASVGGKRA